MNTERQLIPSAAVPVFPAPLPLSHLRDNGIMFPVQARLRKHADYQRVYKASRKHFSQSMSYFFRLRSETEPVPAGPRVGLTAGRVLGKAVERNRIKRRLREAVRANLDRLPVSIDVVLHPRQSVAEMEYAKLTAEIANIFSKIDLLISSQREKSRPTASKSNGGAS